MKNRRPLTLLAICGILVAGLNLSFVRGVSARSNQMKTDVEQLAMDIHAGVARSTLTPQQKVRFRDDFRQLRKARQNHELFAEMHAMRRIRETLDSGAFKPEDRDRIKQDLQNIRAARHGHPGIGG